VLGARCPIKLGSDGRSQWGCEFGAEAAHAASPHDGGAARWQPGCRPSTPFHPCRMRVRRERRCFSRNCEIRQCVSRALLTFGAFGHYLTPLNAKVALAAASTALRAAESCSRYRFSMARRVEVVVERLLSSSSLASICFMSTSPSVAVCRSSALRLDLATTDMTGHLAVLVAKHGQVGQVAPGVKRVRFQAEALPEIRMAGLRCSSLRCAPSRAC